MSQQNALCWSAWTNNTEAVGHLVEANPALWARSYTAGDARSFTPFHYASSLGNNDILSLLSSHAREPQAGLNARDNHDGNTPLLHAVLQRHEETAVWLVESGADVNMQNFAGETPLFVAAKFGLAALVRFLLESGANPQIATVDGATPLHAAACGHTEVCQVLAQCGAHLNAGDDEGDTPLHYAVREGQVAIADLLVRCGASLSAANEDGETALDLARELGEEAILGGLQQQSRFTAPSMPCATPLAEGVGAHGALFTDETKAMECMEWDKRNNLSFGHVHHFGQKMVF